MIKSRFCSSSFLVFLLFNSTLVCCANTVHTNELTLYEITKARSKENDSLRFQLVVHDPPNPPKRRKRLTNPIGLNPSPGALAAPSNSAQNVDPIVGISITSVFILFVIYIAVRVRKLLRKDQQQEKWRRNRRQH